MTWPDGERRREYVDLLITLNADVKHITNKVEDLLLKMDLLTGVKKDIAWLKWTDRGILIWLSGLTWWIIKKI